MRERGANKNLTDIIVMVVSAVDSVRPQTKEVNLHTILFCLLTRVTWMYYIILLLSRSLNLPEIMMYHWW